MSEKLIASLIAFFIAAIVLTPYCGWLFDCGCTWPWAGLDADCNNHKPNTLHKCPWCGNYVKGFISTTLIVGGSAVLAYNLKRVPLVTRLAASALFFLTVGFITGWISAALQGYPHFVI